MRYIALLDISIWISAIFLKGGGLKLADCEPITYLFVNMVEPVYNL